MFSLEADVLAHYPADAQGPITPLANQGGFSGAFLFRVASPAGVLCLRLWPLEMAEAQLAIIHALMRGAVDAGLDFVPRILPTGAAKRTSGPPMPFGSCLPGCPARRRFGNRRHLSACAPPWLRWRLHGAWATIMADCAPCPAVERRLVALRYWLPVIQSNWQPPSDPLDPVAAPAQQAWATLRRRLPELPGILMRWMSHAVPLQPCHCDVLERSRPVHPRPRHRPGRFRQLQDRSRCRRFGPPARQLRRRR